MKPSLSIALLAATMFIAAPAIHSLSPVSLLGDSQALAAGNGNGNGGNGNGGGKGNAGGGNRGNSADHAHGNTGKSGGGSSKSSSSGKTAGSSGSKVIAPKKSASATAKTKAKTAVAAAPEKKNIHAQLKGLNSLKRNINGMMNSADPRMAELREYIKATGDLQATTAALAEADKKVATTLAAYQDLGLEGANADPKLELDALKTEAAGIDAKIKDPNTPSEDLAGLQQQLDTLNHQIEVAQAYVDALDEQAAAKTAYDAAVTAAGSAPTLDEAIEAAKSPNTELSSDAMDWAKGQVDRLVTDYVAKL